MKNILFYITFMFAAINMNAQVTITQATGWMECAYVKWEPLTGVDSYNVYYTGGTLTNQQIDTQLIRSYGSYFRADVLGLAPGTYTMKVVPVTAGIEGASAVSSSVTVTAHDKNGFAHAGGRIPGAYNLDGTLKGNAVVLYITQNTRISCSSSYRHRTSVLCILCYI